MIDTPLIFRVGCKVVAENTRVLLFGDIVEKIGPAGNMAVAAMNGFKRELVRPGLLVP